MNRFVLLCAGVCLLLGAGTAWAADTIPGEAAVTPAATAATDFTPAPVEMTGCSAEFDCGDGNIIDCTGNYSCYVNYGGWVECDGNREYCPNYCMVSKGCKCGTIWCSSPSGDCAVTGGGVQCDGDLLTCFEFCFGP